MPALLLKRSRPLCNFGGVCRSPWDRCALGRGAPVTQRGRGRFSEQRLVADGKSPKFPDAVIHCDLRDRGGGGSARSNACRARCNRRNATKRTGEMPNCSWHRVRSVRSDTPMVRQSSGIPSEWSKLASTASWNRCVSDLPTDLNILPGCLSVHEAHDHRPQQRMFQEFRQHAATISLVSLWLRGSRSPIAAVAPRCSGTRKASGDGNRGAGNLDGDKVQIVLVQCQRYKIDRAIRAMI